MRICLVTHGFPPVERTGVENYTEALALALARAGHRVEVFVPRRDPLLANYSVRREDRQRFAVNWVTSNEAPQGPRDHLFVPGVRLAFGSFLEREQPELVHFQHLIKLGVDLVEEARTRGIPTVYTAHDYYPICHRYTLLRPDLERCEVRGDPAACSRCDLALGFLNGIGRLGDYQMGALPQQLDIGERQALAGILEGQVPSGREDEFRRALELRRELDERRAHAFRGLGRILAPSQALAEELVRGGIERQRVQHLSYGFENADLEALARTAPVRPSPTRPLRFAFTGGTAKHKGLHVLLDAFEKVSSRCELSIWGGSSDSVHVEFLRRRAGEVGAQWRGPYERSELPGILAQVDVVVVPSIWLENQPLVIHEAFSAGRPVLASRVGALPESVRDDVDGLLFECGDAEDLARVMARCIEEQDLVPQLVKGIRPVKTIDENTRELLAVYAELIESARRGAGAAQPLPESLQEALDGYRALSSLPARELFVRVLSGLDGLREAWSGEVGSMDVVELLALGLGGGSEVQDLLRESKAEIAWLRSKKSELDRGREELMALFEEADRDSQERQEQERALREAEERVRRGEQEVAAAKTRLFELEEALRAKEEHARSVEAELDEASQYIRRKESEVEEIEGQLGEAGRYIEGKDQDVRRVEDELGAAARYIRRKEHEQAELEAELVRLSTLAEDKQRELATARSDLSGLEQRFQRTRGDLKQTAELGFQAVQAIERLFGRSLWSALESVRRLAGGESAGAGAPGTLHGSLAALREIGESLRLIEAELLWRRSEMHRLQAKLGGGLPRLVLGRTGMGRQIGAWDRHEQELAEDGR